MYETINSPFKLGNVTLKNRIIFAPTSMGLKEEEYLEKLGAIARGGTAMIIIGDVPVLKSPFLSLYSKKGFLRYRFTKTAPWRPPSCTCRTRSSAV